MSKLHHPGECRDVLPTLLIISRHEFVSLMRYVQLAAGVVNVVAPVVVSRTQEYILPPASKIERS